MTKQPIETQAEKVIIESTVWQRYALLYPRLAASAFSGLIGGLVISILLMLFFYIGFTSAEITGDQFVMMDNYCQDVGIRLDHVEIRDGDLFVFCEDGKEESEYFMHRRGLSEVQDWYLAKVAAAR
jgi:hypothetical protein